MPRSVIRRLALVAAFLVAVTACSVTPQGGGSAPPAEGPQQVRLQLQWFKQGQFAGYIAAVEQGFYAERGLDVEILEGGVDIVPQTVLAQGQADFAIAWVPKALASREQGAGITDVAQIFQRSGTYQVAFADKGITTPADLKGKKVGNWGFGNEFELFAGMTKAGLTPATDVTLVQQQFDMQALLSGEIDAAQAMSYNEYAQVLEATNPATGQLYQPSDFSVIDWNETGTAMLQDAIWASTERLQDPAYQDLTTRFIAGSLEGWAYCRDNVESCRDMVVAAGSTLGASHQLWQVNEVNKLIWPSPDGAGSIDEAAWTQTVQVARTAVNADGQTVLTRDPDAEAHTNTYVQRALDQLRGEGVDVTGEGYQPIEVTLNPGGA
ncbi:NitT/TauT family transport system substrate-binding protein [Pseudonocardia hierapolitana]|uniref:Thiamine pyrimidine synthase n=1 Tax=Pseudonocardia hierapolitana TaxID=1128676 RepID=A0A561SYZ3_9PSEU|nr:ABC transporter substrate-binding protein [Pseudonocardia hierapolitana]TWF80087.1 NitT/TauT family transport system substrate-binding protein [Pseudonocardia hierapolitana]